MSERNKKTLGYDTMLEMKDALDDSVIKVFDEMLDKFYIHVPYHKVVRKLDAFCTGHCHGRDEKCISAECPVWTAIEMLEGPDDE